MTALTHEYVERLAGKIITSFKTNVVLGEYFPPPYNVFTGREEGGGGRGRAKNDVFDKL